MSVLLLINERESERERRVSQKYVKLNCVQSIKLCVSVCVCQHIARTHYLIGFFRFTFTVLSYEGHTLMHQGGNCGFWLGVPYKRMLFVYYRVYMSVCVRVFVRVSECARV